ncbi:MAG: nicotinamide riboside transporter PnuC [Chitinophagia bacterium]|jgi:nicotinamide mononucleotide transporter
MDFLEITAILSGITSVWFSKKENIWVYPTGLVGTILYVYISFQGELYGEATVNLYYTIMSLYGWYNWLRRDQQQELIVHITQSSKSEWIMEIGFFLTLYLVLFFALTYIQQSFSPGAIPWADALASASAFTGMWLMTRKKLNSWIWWIITNISSIPLYYTKGYTLTSWYYFILLILAILGWIEWRKKANEQAA